MHLNSLMKFNKLKIITAKLLFDINLNLPHRLVTTRQRGATKSPTFISHLTPRNSPSILPSTT